MFTSSGGFRLLNYDYSSFEVRVLKWKAGFESLEISASWQATWVFSSSLSCFRLLLMFCSTLQVLVYFSISCWRSLICEHFLVRVLISSLCFETISSSLIKRLPPSTNFDLSVGCLNMTPIFLKPLMSCCFSISFSALSFSISGSFIWLPIILVS